MKPAIHETKGPLYKKDYTGIHLIYQESLDFLSFQEVLDMII